MSKLLIQDDILNGMDVYVEYTIDYDDTDGPEVILYDYGIELTNSTRLGDGKTKETTAHVSLRGFAESAWMPEKLTAYIEYEEGITDARPTIS